MSADWMMMRGVKASSPSSRKRSHTGDFIRPVNSPDKSSSSINSRTRIERYDQTMSGSKSQQYGLSADRDEVLGNNKKHDVKGVDWHFTTPDVRANLKHLYQQFKI